ncbi:hypothetical protein EAO77_01130 [Streptomyces sp. t39]|nr:hypothetical protein EAO77_01130 [Streptomyces sp. t39]
MPTVRGRIVPGRLLPLGGPKDGTWITEQAAVGTLWPTAEIPGVRLESMRIGPDPGRAVSAPVVLPPAGALPPGPLRIEAAITTSATLPLHRSAERLRTLLLDVAAAHLGLTLVAVDLRVTDLHDAMETESSPQTVRRAESPAAHAAPSRSAFPAAGAEPLYGQSGRLATVASAVPGVARLTALPGGRPIAVEHQDDPPGTHIEVRLAIAPGHRPLDVTRAVRAAVSAAAADDITGPASTAVLVTEVAARPSR